MVKLRISAIEFDFTCPFVRNRTIDAAGSGFFVDPAQLGLDVGPRRILLTNAHVLRDNYDRRVLLYLPELGQVPIEGRAIHISADQQLFDVGVVEVDPAQCSEATRAVLATVPNLELEEDTLHVTSMAALAIGFPLQSDDYQCTKGVLSGRRDNLFQMDTSISPGNSGGALMDTTTGRVIGIPTSACTMEDADGINFATPISQVLNYFARWAPASAPSILRLPHWGARTQNTTAFDLEHRGHTGAGALVSEVREGSMRLTGVHEGDVLVRFEVGGSQTAWTLDHRGMVQVPWCDMPVALDDTELVLALSRASRVSLVVEPRGESTERALPLRLTHAPSAVRTLVPHWEPIDCVAFAGMIFMNLSENHLMGEALTDDLVVDEDQLPWMTTVWQSAQRRRTDEPKVILTHIVHNTHVGVHELVKSRSILTRVMGRPVATIDMVRDALAEALASTRRARTLSLGFGPKTIHLPLDALLDEERILRDTIPGYPGTAPRRRRKRRHQN